MRRPWLALLAASLNVNFGFSALRSRIRRRERLWGLALLGAGIAVVAGLLFFTVFVVVGEIAAGAAALGQPELVLTLVHFSAAMVVFFFGVPFVMGSFYFSNDAPLLNTWPLKPRSIVSAKFVTVLLSEYVTLLFFLVPAYVHYARHAAVGAWYVPAAVATFLLTPVVPLALAALITLALMRAVSGTNKREHFAVAAAAVALAVSLAMQYFLYQSSDVIGDFSRLILERAYGLSEYLAVGYPPALWSMLAMARAGTLEGFAALAGLAGAGFIASVALAWAGERTFLKAAQASGAPRAAKSGAAALTKASPTVWSIARAEWRVFLRSPMYVFNSMGVILLMPVLVLMPALGEGDRLGLVMEIGRVSPYVALSVIWAWFPLAAGLSVIPSTAVSREGQRLWVLKSLPVSGKEYFLGKLIGGQILILPTALPGALVFGYIMKVSAVTFALGLLLGVLSSFLVSALCLTLDMVRPWLTWTDPTRAVKSNANGFIGMIGTAAAVGLAVFGAIRLSARGLAASSVVALYSLVIAAAAAALWFALGPRLEQLLRRTGE